MRGLLALLCLAACGGTPAQITVPRSTGIAIGTVTLKWSQVHAVFGTHVLLVDAGSDGELGALVDGLTTLGADLRDVRCVVITHGHADHAGNAKALQDRGIKVIAGARDRERMRRGVHGDHHPTGLVAHVLAWFLPDHYAGFTADIEVTDRYDLSPCGIAAEVIAMPGHTPGSLVVLLDGGKVALVGDQFRGGLAYPEMPVEHFYQDDLDLDHAQIRALLARGVEWFVLGHGGPIARAAVAEKFGR